MQMIEITHINIYPFASGPGAYVSITLGNCFVITGITVRQGKFGFFVSMPQSKNDKGFFDICHPISKDYRLYINEEILKKFNQTGG